MLYYIWDFIFIELIVLYYRYLNFIRECMEWFVDQLRYNEFWLLDFVVKLFLGYYCYYNYLKLFNVGLEFKIYILFYLDEMKEFFVMERKKLEYKGYY